MRALIALVAAAVVLGAAPSIRAEDKATARAAYAEGTKYYDLNQFEAALKAFEKAYWNYEEPAFLFNIAQCYRQLEKKPEAVKFYRSFLRKVPETPNRTDVERLIASLEAAIAKEPKPAAKTEPTPPRAPEPQPAVAAATAPSAAPALAKADGRRPLYKKWWLWTAVAVVVAGGVTTAAVLATRPAPSWSNVTDFGPGAMQALVRW